MTRWRWVTRTKLVVTDDSLPPVSCDRGMQIIVMKSGTVSLTIPMLDGTSQPQQTTIEGHKQMTPYYQLGPVQTTVTTNLHSGSLWVQIKEACVMWSSIINLILVTRACNGFFSLTFILKAYWLRELGQPRLSFYPCSRNVFVPITSRVLAPLNSCCAPVCPIRIFRAIFHHQCTVVYAQSQAANIGHVSTYIHIFVQWFRIVWLLRQMFVW